jgi:photosystem II stability/assembly factor-like uncharacterized protein
VRSKIDEGRDRGRARRKVKPPKGGKALQRLLTYLAQRDPKLIPEAVPIDVPAASQPRVGRVRDVLKTSRAAAPAARGRSARARAKRPRRALAASKAFASALSRAATKMPKPRRRASRAARAKTRGRRVAPPPASATVWTEIGPTHIPQGQTYGSNRVEVIGRVSSFAVDPSNPKHLLCGSANGGIWESGDRGSSWVPRTDQMPTLAIGAVTFDPHDPSRVYAGSGEGNFYASLGAGVYRSNDGGTTWTVLATTPFVGMGFYDLIVDPIDRRILYAATSNGFYVSTNSGANWSLKRAMRCWGISVHPAGGTVEVLAAFADGLFASSNAGSSFTAVALPSTPGAGWARLAVDRVAADPQIAYAFGAAGSTPHLWRRSGTAWTKIAQLPSPAINVTQAWYDWCVAASPTSSREVYLGAIDGYRGRLTGNTWTWKNITTNGNKSIHPDQHSLSFAPDDSTVIYAGNDGGVYRSNNSGASWTPLNKGLGITEVEYLGSDPNTWQWLMAGTQDNGTIRYTGSTEWEHIADGDGGDCGVNQLNPDEVYHSFYNVSLERSDDKGDTWTWLAPPAVPSLFYPPVEVSGATLAIGGASLVITRTGGPPWTTVSLGLPSGDGASAMRAADANTFIIGTTKGRMLRAAWNGTSWKITNLTSPAPRYISCVAIDPGNPTRIWVTLSQLGGGRVFRSDDAGVTWTDCSSGLPPIPINSVVVDPANYQRVWVSADVGVYQTSDLGATWSPFSAGLPHAMAVDLLLHKQDRVLLCGTRNRGVWAIHVP